MSFLQLPPAARRLRKAARAHAAGEMERSDYRRLRREIIEELHVQFASGTGGIDEFTRQPDETRRRTDEAPALQPSFPVPAKPKKPLATALLVVIVLLAAIFLGTVASAAVIPPVRDRDPNPSNSLVLRATEIRLTNVDSLSATERAELERNLASWFLAERTKANDTAGHGFTASELNEVGNLLHRLGMHTEDGLGESAAAALNSLAQRQAERRGVTLRQLEVIAERVQDYLRERGYIAAAAYVPAQVVQDGVAELEVQLGRIEAIELPPITPLARLSKRAFAPQLGQVVHSEPVEQLLYRLNELPGVQAGGSLRAGTEVGSTALELRVKNERKFKTQLALDSYGDARSSRYRAGVGATWLNPLRRGDRLDVRVASRFHRNSGFEGGISYEMPTRRLGNSMRLFYRNEDFAARGANSSVEGASDTYGIGFRSLRVGERKRSLALGVTAVVQELRLVDELLDTHLSGSLAGGDMLDTHQNVQWVAPYLEGHQVLDGARWVFRGRAEVSAGEISSGRFANQPGGFVRARIRASAWRPVGEQELRLHIAGQAGSRDLPDSQKLTLGGWGGNVALPPSAFVADSLVMAGAEFSFTPEPFRRFGELAVFTRLGHAQRRLSGEHESAFAWDGGVIWRLSPQPGLSADLRLGLPFSTDGLEDSHDGARVLFGVTWQP